MCNIQSCVYCQQDFRSNSSTQHLCRRCVRRPAAQKVAKTFRWVPKVPKMEPKPETKLEPKPEIKDTFTVSFAIDDEDEDFHENFINIPAHAELTVGELIDRLEAKCGIGRQSGDFYIESIFEPELEHHLTMEQCGLRYGHRNIIKFFPEVDYV